MLAVNFQEHGVFGARVLPTFVYVGTFMALLGDDDVGLFVCTGGFKGCGSGSSNSEKRRVRLIAVEKLFDLWKEHALRQADGSGATPLTTSVHSHSGT